MDQWKYPPPPPLAYERPPGPPPWNGKTNGFSIASLTLSLFGCIGLLSIIFGIIGLRQSLRNGDRRGKIFAIWGLSISGLVLLAIATAIAVAVVRDVTDGPDRDANGAIRDERSISVASLRAGDCIKDLEEQSGSRVDVVPCAEPHTSEIVAVFTLPDGPWPGISGVGADGDAGCETRFAAVKPDETAWFLFASPPDFGDWPEHREVLCIADYRNGTTTGSLLR
ncbi:MAG: hypothetical protein ABW022_19100 [Actinoplanes sp.]